MNSKMAWFLGYLLSDGAITHPSYRGKGDETHMQFICKYADRELMHKVKAILGIKAVVHDYSEYKSPQPKIRVYDRRDIIDEFSDIKERVPVEAIKGYERDFIRGCVDGDGTISYRASRNAVRFGFIDEKKEITDWVCDTLVDTLMLPPKAPRWVPQNNVWEILWEGNLARLIIWWLYHGDIDDCCLSRKHELYKKYVLDNNTFDNQDQELLYVSHTVLDERNEIMPIADSNRTLAWCKRIQHLLDVNSTPVFHNKGTHKYYRLHIKDSDFIANMRDTQLFELPKA